MRSLLRADLYQLAHSRWPKVLLACILAIAVGEGILLRVQAGAGSGMIEGDTQALMDAASFAGWTDQQAMALVSGGAAELAVGIVAAVLAHADEKGGWARTVLSARRGHAAYYAEKCLFVALVGVVIMLVAVVAGPLFVAVSGYGIADPEPVGKLALWLAAFLAEAVLISELALLVTQVTRSQTVGVVFSFVLVLGFVGVAIAIAVAAPAEALGVDPAALEAVLSWLPSVSISTVRQGALAATTPDATGVAPAVRVLAVALPVAVASAAVFVRALSRRDV